LYNDFFSVALTRRNILPSLIKFQLVGKFIFVQKTVF